MKSEIEPTDRLCQSIVVVVLAHGFLGVSLLAICLFLAPVLAGMYADIGRPLWFTTQLAFNLSNFVRRCSIVAIPWTALLLFLDAFLYAWLYRNRPRRLASAWFWCVFGLLILVILNTVGALLLPLCFGGSYLSVSRG